MRERDRGIARERQTEVGREIVREHELSTALLSENTQVTDMCL